MPLKKNILVLSKGHSNLETGIWPCLPAGPGPSQSHLYRTSSLKCLCFHIFHVALFRTISVASYRNPVQIVIRLRKKKGGGDLLVSRTESHSPRIVGEMCWKGFFRDAPLSFCCLCFSLSGVIQTDVPQVELKIVISVSKLLFYQVSNLSIRADLR